MAKCKMCGDKLKDSYNGLCAECCKRIEKDIEDQKNLLGRLAKEASPDLPSDDKARIYNFAISACKTLINYKKMGAKFDFNEIEICRNNVLENLGLKSIPLRKEIVLQNSNKYGCLFIIVVFAIIIFSLHSCVSRSVNAPPSPPTTFQIMVDSQLAVKAALKAPSTAKFGNSDNFEIQEISKHEYIVSSFVDAQNSFGAMLRNNFTVALRYSKDWSDFDVTAIDIDGDGFNQNELKSS